MSEHAPFVSANQRVMSRECTNSCDETTRKRLGFFQMFNSKKLSETFATKEEWEMGPSKEAHEFFVLIKPDMYETAENMGKILACEDGSCRLDRWKCARVRGRRPAKAARLVSRRGALKQRPRLRMSQGRRKRSHRQQIKFIRKERHLQTSCPQRMSMGSSYGRDQEA